MESQVANQPVLVVDALGVTFHPGPDEVRAVKEASFEIAAGEILGLAGRSGCGKSTVARALLGLDDRREHAVEGRILFHGQELGSVGAPRFDQVRGSGIGLVPQDSMASLTPVHTVGSLVEETLRAHFDLSSREAAIQTLVLLEEVGFEDADDVAGRHPHELSGGMKQRVAIALALAPRPQLLVADEPTAALDTISQAQILHLIRQIRERRGMSVLLITHDLTSIVRTADRVAVMDEGRIVETGPVSDLLATADGNQTRALLKSRLRPETSRVRIPGQPTLLDIKAIHVSFSGDSVRFGSSEADQVEALRGASLEIDAAETVALIGGSGSGKTTLARCVAGLVKPDAGSMTFDGSEIVGMGRRDMRSVRRRIGFVIQDSASAFNPLHTVEKSVATPLISRGREHRARRAALARVALGRVGLRPDQFDRLPHELSGGERQRAALARALVIQPELLICDEPVSGLDGVAEMELLELIDRVTRETGLACLFITHSFTTARTVADRVAIMHEGQVVESGSFEAVFNDPKHPHTAALLKAAEWTAGSDET